MSIALVKPLQQDHTEPLYFRQSEAKVTMELDNVAHGLKYFAEQLGKTKSAQAQFAKVVQLKTWVMNKPTLETLLEQYLGQIEQAQHWLHLDAQNYQESVESLCEQLLFLSAVFEQERELIDQTVFMNSALVLCD